MQHIDINEKGVTTMRTIGHTTKIPRAGRSRTIGTGFFAMLSGLLRGRGSGAPRIVSVAAIATFAVMAFGAASASANQPWWHLLSGARPTYLRPTGGPVLPGLNEVQELTVPSGSFFAVFVEGNEIGYFENGGPYGGSLKITAAKLQEKLEDNAYGASNVTVTEKAGVEPGEILLLVESVGADAVKTVAPLEVGEVFSGSPEAKVKTRAQAGHKAADGTLAATVINVGSTAAGECVKVGSGGKWANSACTEPAVPGVGSIPGMEEYEKDEAVKIVDDLPAGLEAVSAEVGVDSTNGYNPTPCSYTAARVECTLPTVAPFEPFEVDIGVVVDGKADVPAVGVNESEDNEVSVSGGGAPAQTIRRAVKYSDEKVPFGIETYELTPEEEGGAPDTQAGSHPFQTTFTFAFNQLAETHAASGHVDGNPAGLPRDVNDNLPPGLIGNPQAVARCTSAEFLALHNECPPESVVGVAIATVGEPDALGTTTASVPLYNLEPSKGEPARFGFLPILGRETPVYIDTFVRSGGDYGIVGDARDIPQTIGALSSVLTFWGVPGKAEHDETRDGCLAAIAVSGDYPPCRPLGEKNPPPFFELPTYCPVNAAGRPVPMQTSVEMDSWEEPGIFDPGNDLKPYPSTEPLPALDGCDSLPFEPSITAKPDGEAASSSSGLDVDVHVPQTASLNANGLGESDPRNITVTLPAGMQINPSGGDGLEACSEGLVGFTGEGASELLPGVVDPEFTPHLPGSVGALEAGETAPMAPGINFCSTASKIGTAEIITPLLPPEQHIKGAVYLASQNTNPFGSLIAMYIVAEDPTSGVLVKLAGRVELGNGSNGLAPGQIRTTFENSPQAPFEDAKLEFFGGERAPLATPSHCGSYTTQASFTSWSQEAGEPVHQASSTFKITEGPNHTPCPGVLPFNPTLTGGATNIQAGAFSPLTGTFAREDGEQNVARVRFTLPPGLSGILTNVPLCGEQQANEGTCPAASQIGETTVSAGVGSDPVSVTGGKVYITEGYHGAPFGLSVVNPVKAGPFDLERDTSNPAQNPPCDCVVVRAKIEINPYTSALTITTNGEGEGYAIPHFIDGIPVQLKRINFITTRPNFQFNPTNCSKMAITGTVESDEGASHNVEVPFQVTNCATLKFTPKFAVSVTGKNSKAGGSGLSTSVTEPAGALGTQANIAKVKVELPLQLPSRLTTLQKACTDKQFEENPANCPPESKIGYAVVHTPLIPVPLQGPAIFVSHGGEAFPSLTMVLQGYGITIDLVGATDIKNGITSTTFKTVPDQPFDTFSLTLPQGKFSALSTNVPEKDHYSLCGQKLTMPNEFVAQNGAVIKQDTTISVTGCAKKKTLTRAQKLAAALKVCKHKAKAKRAACRKQAYKQYGPLKKSKKKGDGGRK